MSYKEEMKEYVGNLYIDKQNDLFLIIAISDDLLGSFRCLEMNGTKDVTTCFLKDFALGLYTQIA